MMLSGSRLFDKLFRLITEPRPSRVQRDRRGTNEGQGGMHEHWHTVSKPSGISVTLIEPHPSAGGDMSSMNESVSAM